MIVRPAFRVCGSLNAQELLGVQVPGSVVVKAAKRIADLALGSGCTHRVIVNTRDISIHGGKMKEVFCRGLCWMELEG